MNKLDHLMKNKTFADAMEHGRIHDFNIFVEAYCHVRHGALTHKGKTVFYHKQYILAFKPTMLEMPGIYGFNLN